MLLYIARRLLLMIPTLLGVLAVVFFVMAYAPGGFGGRTLGAEGQQKEGEDAKRIRQQWERRYGLNLSKPAQFGRWLNQVSPVGFRMSSAIEFTEEENQAVTDALKGLPLNTREATLGRAVKLALDMAAYQARDPARVAKELASKLERPGEAFDLFASMGVTLDAQRSEQLEQRIAELLPRENGLARAQNEFVDTLAGEIAGLSRVRFDRPAVKIPDFGESLRGRRVTDLLMERVPITVLLNLITVPIIYGIAIVSGLYAARHRGTVVDLGTGFTFVALWSIPSIWAAVMLVTYVANEQHVRLFPTTGLHDLQSDAMAFLPRWVDGDFQRGWLLDAMWHLVLPITVMVYGGFAVMSKVMRGSILDTLSADYVRTARAKGVSETNVLWRHAFRNAVIPLITMLAGILPGLLGGAIIVESVFSIPGMGKLGVDAAFEKDREVLMATTLIASILVLLCDIARDVFYAIADPRVTYE